MATEMQRARRTGAVKLAALSKLIEDMAESLIGDDPPTEEQIDEVSQQVTEALNRMPTPSHRACALLLMTSGMLDALVLVLSEPQGPARMVD